MIFPSIEAFRESGFEARLCIVGSGPAGITCARKAAESGVPVVILEAGEREFSERSQDSYRGETEGDHYFDLDVARLRYFGGSSNHWAGWCRVLDAYDFEKRSYIPYSGWPIRRADIEPYLEETRDILGIERWFDDKPVTEDIQLVDMIKSDAVRFQEKYGEELDKSENIALVLDTFVTQFEGDGTRVNGAVLHSADGPAGTLVCDSYVAATGGLENSRLLLWSNELTGGAVVPQAQALGRFWMEHNHFQVGRALLFKKDAIAWDSEGEAFLAGTQAALDRRQIGNFAFRVVPMPYRGTKQMIAELACVAPGLTNLVSENFGLRLNCAAQLHLAWEQAPDPQNRITLMNDERDEAGVPRILLQWEKREFERRTMMEAMRLLGGSFARNGIGRVRFDDWVLFGEGWPEDLEIAGYHHMGGTRMGTDPSVSVVDRDCKVHGMANLFVGGSSVFVTSGQSTPTTTITALAVRLGTHLGRLLGT